jgi:hypothetical protein
VSDYQSVKHAMEAGTPPELICASCPWDRLCITPPQMTGADIDRHIKAAEAKDAERDPLKQNMPVGLLMTTLLFAGKDTTAQLCPVFSLKLRSPEGREVADTLRVAMRGEK